MSLGSGELTLESAVAAFDTSVHYCADTAEAYRLIPGTSVVALTGPSRARFYQAHTSPVGCMATAPEAGVAATAAGMGASWELHVWNPTDLTTLVALSPPAEGGAGAVAALSFSHAGERLVALLHGADPRAVYWHWRSGSEAQILGYNVAMDGPTTWLLALPDAPSGYAQLLTGNAQMLRFWTGSSEGMTSIDAAPATAAEGATCLLEVPTPPVDGAADGARGGGGALVLSAHASGALCAWRLWQGTEQKQAGRLGLVSSADGHQGAALALASCDAEKTLVASGGSDGRVRVWSVYLDPVRTINLAHCWAARPMLTRLAVAGVAQASDAPAGPPIVRALCSANDGTLLACTGDLLSVNTSTGQCTLVSCGGHGEPWGGGEGTGGLLVATSPSGAPGGGADFASAAADRTLRVWRCEGGDACALVHSARLAGTPSALAWATRGVHLAVADTGGGLQLFRRERLIAEAARAAIPAGSWATCLAFDALDTRLASGSADGHVSIWRLPELQPIHTFAAHPPSSLLSVDWSTAGPASPGAALLTSAAPTGQPMEARVWRAADGALLAEVTDEQPIGRDDGAMVLPTGRGAPSRLVDGALLAWPWQSYTCPVGWQLGATSSVRYGGTSRLSTVRRITGEQLGGDWLAAVSHDGSFHLAPFACTGVLDASTRLLTSTSKGPPSALAISSDGSLVFTTAPAPSAGTAGAVLVWRLQKPSVPPRRAIGPPSGRVPDPTESPLPGRTGGAAGLTPPHMGLPVIPHLRLPALPTHGAPMPPPAVGGSGGDVACVLGSSIFVSSWRGGGGTRMYAEHEGVVSALAVHPSGGVVASGQAGSVRVWSLASLQTLAVLGNGVGSGYAPSSFAPTHLSFSPDGRSLLSLVPHPTAEDAAAMASSADARTVSAIVEALDAMNEKLVATEAEAAKLAAPEGDTSPYTFVDADEAPRSSRRWDGPFGYDEAGMLSADDETGMLSADDDDEPAGFTSVEEALAFTSSLLQPPTRDEEELDEVPTRASKRGKRAPRRVPDLQPADAEAQDAAVDNQLASAILAVWGWTGGPAARPLAGGVVHVTRPLAQARAHHLPALCACFVLEEESGMRPRDGGGGGVRLASAGVGHVRFWRVHGQQLLVDVDAPDAHVLAPTSGGPTAPGGVYLCCCATPSGVFFGSDDGALLHFAPATGGLLQRISAHCGPISTLVALGPLDSTPGITRAAVASGGVDGRIRLWSAAATPCAEWRVGQPVNALRDSRGRPLDDGGGSGDAARDVTLRGLSWAGPRGAVAQVGRASLAIEAAGGATELCMMAVPTACGCEALAYNVWRGLPLPACEQATVRPIGQQVVPAAASPHVPARWEAPEPPKALAVARAGMMATATTTVPLRAGASSDGWGRDDEAVELPVKTEAEEPQEGGAAALGHPALTAELSHLPMSNPMTVRIGGWRSEVPSNVSFAAGGGAHVCHEALSRWA